MGKRLILDTGVLIAVERGVVDLDVLLGSDDAVMAAISVAELLLGVHRSPQHLRETRHERAEFVLKAVPVVAYTADTARVHASLVAQAMARGRPRSSCDLIVAATAASTRRTLLTTDAAADFGSLPGVSVRVIDPESGVVT